eukprot:446384-Prorocentrum_minimum.AAC.3
MVFCTLTVVALLVAVFMAGLACMFAAGRLGGFPKFYRDVREKRSVCDDISKNKTTREIVKQATEFVQGDEQGFESRLAEQKQACGVTV